MWIQRVNAAVREHGMVYSQFMHGLKLAGVDLNRKMLSEMAIHNAEAFAKVIDLAKKALNKEAA